MSSEPLSPALAARAVLCGERIDLKSLEAADRLASAPLVVPAGASGKVALFRYGAVVFFGAQPVEEAAFLHHLGPFVQQPLLQPETEELQIRFDPGRDERIEGSVLFLRDDDVARLQLVADVLAKSVVLAFYENSLAALFDQIEPLAAELEARGSATEKGKELLRQIARTLLIQQKMVGRVEVDESPELLWERSELDRLYQRLVDEYDLRDRSRALDRKLELVSRTASTLFDLWQARRSLRVEWYIVLLIVVEILLTLYELFFRG